MHDRDKWMMEKEFPKVPEKIHGMVLETLENLEEENFSMKKGGNTMKNNRNFDDITLKPGEELGEEALGEFTNGKGDDNHE